MRIVALYAACVMCAFAVPDFWYAVVLWFLITAIYVMDD